MDGGDVKQELDIAYKKERDQFFEKLQEFHKARGTPFQRIPTFGGQPLDLYALYNTVVSFGGICVVTEKKKWGQVFRALGFPPCTNAAYALKQHYSRYLEIYERIFFLGEDTEDTTATRSYAQMLKYRRINKAPKLGPLGEQLVDNFNRISFSLQSGLQNEVDFALNICSLLSNVPNSIFNLAKSPAILDLMLGHVGIWSKDESYVKQLYDEWYTKSEKDFVEFWRMSLDDQIARKIYEEDNLNSTVSIEQSKTKEENSKLFVDKDVDVDVNSAECCRINQVCIILYNFSFEQMNALYLASHNGAIRFLLLASCCNHSNIQRAGLDALDNIANNIILEGMENTFTQRFLKIMDTFLHSKDKFRRCRAMSILAKLATKENNKPVLTQTLSQGTYQILVETLYLPDIALILASLDTLYCFTSLDEIIATGIANIHGSIDVLVCLITVRAETYGNKAIRGYRIIENKHSMFTPKNQQWLKEQEQKGLYQNFSANNRASQRHSAHKPYRQPLHPGKYHHNPSLPMKGPPFPNYPGNRHSYNMTLNYPMNNNVHGINLSYPQNSLQTNQHPDELIEIDAATYAANYMSGYYEPHPTNLLYASIIHNDYVSCCNEIHRKGILDLVEFIKVLRSIIPPKLAQILPPDAEGKIGISGIIRRKQPMPVQSKVPRHIHGQQHPMKQQGGPHLGNPLNSMPVGPPSHTQPLKQDMLSPHILSAQMMHSQMPQSPGPKVQLPYSQSSPQITPSMFPQMPRTSMSSPQMPLQLQHSQIPPQVFSQTSRMPSQISHSQVASQMPAHLSRIPPQISTEMPHEISLQMTTKLSSISPQLPFQKPPKLPSELLQQSLLDKTLDKSLLHDATDLQPSTNTNFSTTTTITTTTTTTSSTKSPPSYPGETAMSVDHNTTSDDNISKEANLESTNNTDVVKVKMDKESSSNAHDETDQTPPRNDLVTNGSYPCVSESNDLGFNENNQTSSENDLHSIRNNQFLSEGVPVPNDGYKGQNDSNPVSNDTCSVPSENNPDSNMKNSTSDGTCLDKSTLSLNQTTSGTKECDDASMEIQPTIATDNILKENSLQNEEPVSNKDHPNVTDESGTELVAGTEKQLDISENSSASENQDTIALEFSKNYTNGENLNNASERQELIDKLKTEMQGHFMQFHMHRQHIQAIQMQIQQLMHQTQTDNLPRNIIKNIQMRVQTHHVQMQSHYQRLQQLNDLSEKVQSQLLSKNADTSSEKIAEPMSQDHTSTSDNTENTISKSDIILNVSKSIETMNSVLTGSNEAKPSSLPNLQSSTSALNVSPRGDVTSPNPLSLKQKGQQFIVPPPFPFMQNNMVSIQHGIPNGSFAQSSRMMSPPSSPLIPKATKGSSKGVKSHGLITSPGGKKSKTAKNSRLGCGVGGKRGNAGDERSAFSRVKQGALMNLGNQLCLPFPTATGTMPNFPQVNITAASSSIVGQTTNNNIAGVPDMLQNPLSPGMAGDYPVSYSYGASCPTTNNLLTTKGSHNKDDNSISKHLNNSITSANEMHGVESVTPYSSFNGNSPHKNISNDIILPNTLPSANSLQLNSQTSLYTKALQNINGNRVPEDSSIEVKKLRDLTEQLDSAPKKKKSDHIHSLTEQLDSAPKKKKSDHIQASSASTDESSGMSINLESLQTPQIINYPSNLKTVDLNPRVTVEKLPYNKGTNAKSQIFTNSTNNIHGNTEGTIDLADTVKVTLKTTANIDGNSYFYADEKLTGHEDIDFIKHNENSDHNKDGKNISQINYTNSAMMLNDRNLMVCDLNSIGAKKTVTSMNGMSNNRLNNPALLNVLPQNTSNLTLPSVDSSVRFYSCKWESCKLPPFGNVTGLLSHMIQIHAPIEGQTIACKVPGCSSIKKPRHVMITHFQEKHCLKRNKDGIMSSVPLPKITLSKDMEWKFEDESPVTRSVRHTAALILRNIARISSYGKKLILPYEDQLALVAISASEAASSAAECLQELSRFPKDILSDTEDEMEDPSELQDDHEGTQNIIQTVIDDSLGTPMNMDITTENIDNTTISVECRKVGIEEMDIN